MFRRRRRDRFPHGNGNGAGSRSFRSGRRLQAGQRILHAVIHGGEHFLFIGKLDLGLCRMHIDIGLPRVNADRQHGGGEALDRQKRTERLLNSRSERLGIYRPAVDKIELHCAATARRLRQRNEARYADAVKVVFHRHHRLGNIAPIYGINGAVQVAVARGAELFRTVYKHLDGNLRMRKRQLSRSGRAGGSFAARRA